jgi:hypothetical protein
MGLLISDRLTIESGSLEHRLHLSSERVVLGPPPDSMILLFRHNTNFGSRRCGFTQVASEKENTTTPWPASAVRATLKGTLVLGIAFS